MVQGGRRCTNVRVRSFHCHPCSNQRRSAVSLGPTTLPQRHSCASSLATSSSSSCTLAHLCTSRAMVHSLSHPSFTQSSLETTTTHPHVPHTHVSVGGDFYIIVRGSVELLHHPITSAATSTADTTFAATDGPGVAVSASLRKVLGARVGTLPAGECFGEHLTQSARGVVRTCSVVATGSEEEGDGSPTLVLQVSAAGKLRGSCEGGSATLATNNRLPHNHTNCAVWLVGQPSTPPSSLCSRRRWRHMRLACSD